MGRARELGVLEAGLEDALSGRGGLVLIGGEAGIGKSRLADELSGKARTRGARVLWGRCWEAGGAPAYWPWVQAIRGYVRDVDREALIADLGSGSADVAQLIPELHEILPEMPAPAPTDPEGARFRLFDATTTFLRQAARAVPLVLVLDDLHAADAPSLLLLQFVAAELGDARILVLGAYREDGLEPEGQLASTLAEVARHRTTRLLRLSGLDEAEIARFIESAVDAPARASLVEAILEDTDGNPLFVGEAIRLLVAGGEVDRAADMIALRLAVPPRLREVIGRRLGLLSDACRGVLTVASVLGREFRLDGLAGATGLTADALLKAMDEAVAARVVTDVPGSLGTLRFSHALVRDVLYESLPPQRRVQLHGEIGEVLEELYADDLEAHLTELAHHFCEAARGGVVDRAVEYTRRAGERAATLLAYEEGVRLFRLSLQVLESKEPVEAGTRCRLLLALGDAEAREGDLATAKETFLRAAEIARREHAPELLAAAALGYGGRFVWARAGSDRHVVPLLEEALRSLPDGDGPIRARLMARLAGALRDERAPDQQDRLSTQAVEMARRIGDPATLSYALEGRFAATWWPDNAEERLAVATEMLQLARQADDAERISQALDWRMSALMELGDVPGVDVELEAMAVLVDEIRQPAQRWVMLNARVGRALLDGRFEEAERLLHESQGLGQRAQQWDAVFQSRIQTYILRWEQGRLNEMEDLIKRSVAEYPTRYAFRCLLAHLFCELERPDSARRAFEELARDNFGDLRRDNDWLFEMSLLPQVADFLGDTGRAGILYDLLSPYRGRHAVTPVEASTGSMSRGLGVLASMLHRWDEATRHFEEALEWNASVGARPWEAHTHHDHARMLLARDDPGDRERALELLSRVLAICQDLGMVALQGKATALLEEYGTSPVRIRAPASSSEPTHGPYVFRREGEYWSIRFERDAFRLKDSKGLRYLAQLLGHPSREFLALQLMTAGLGSGSTRAAPRSGRDLREAGLRPSSGRTGEVLDPQARQAYRRRLEELQEELEEAEGWADSERAARAREEMEFLAHELAAAVGLRGRDRRAPSDAERARVNVTKAIRAALARIAEHSPALGRHLESTIRTGTFCSYVPDPRLPAIWQV